ncbi:RS11 protein, partial [Acromyrmex charruanus]
MKMQCTAVIRRDYLHYIRKYNRFEKRQHNMSVHLSPCFRYIGNKIIFFYLLKFF